MRQLAQASRKASRLISVTESARAAYRIPMRTRFRAITAREGLLIRGSAGWVEVSPFLDYDAPECVPWLRAAHEAAEIGFPPALRDQIPGNVTISAVGPEQAAATVAGSGGSTSVNVKVDEPRQDESEAAN